MKVVSLMLPESVASSPPFRPRKCFQQQVEVVIAQDLTYFLLSGGLYEEDTYSSTLGLDTTEYRWYELAPVPTEDHCKR